MTEINLRDATLDDLPAITEIYEDSVVHGTASYELEAPSLETMRQRFETITGGGFPYIVAEEGDVIIGFAYLSPYRERPAYRFLVEDSIYLSLEARGKGVGKRLLAELIRSGTEAGYRSMVAVIGGSSPASIGVHASLGFKHAGKLTASGYKFEQWLDTIFMELPLGEGASTPPVEIRKD